MQIIIIFAFTIGMNCLQASAAGTETRENMYCAKQCFASKCFNDYTDMEAHKQCYTNMKVFKKCVQSECANKNIKTCECPHDSSIMSKYVECALNRCSAHFLFEDFIENEEEQNDQNTKQPSSNLKKISHKQRQVAKKEEPQPVSQPENSSSLISPKDILIAFGALFVSSIL